jgi:hypothetical protein
MNAAKLEKRSLTPLGGVSIELRRTNCVSLHRSNPNLRPVPCQFGRVNIASSWETRQKHEKHHGDCLILSVPGRRIGETRRGH